MIKFKRRRGEGMSVELLPYTAHKYSAPPATRTSHEEEIIYWSVSNCFQVYGQGDQKNITAYIRPRLEYTSLADYPNWENIDPWEKIYQQATKIVQEVRELSYRQKIAAMGITHIGIEKEEGRHENLFENANFKQSFEIEEID